MKKRVFDRIAVVYKDETNEKDLKFIWRLLKGNEPYQRMNFKGWESVGFQGKDPATDFRGGGVFGLE